MIQTDNFLLLVIENHNFLLLVIQNDKILIVLVPKNCFFNLFLLFDETAVVQCIKKLEYNVKKLLLFLICLFKQYSGNSYFQSFIHNEIYCN